MPAFKMKGNVIGKLCEMALNEWKHSICVLPSCLSWIKQETQNYSGDMAPCYGVYGNKEVCSWGLNVI